MSNYQITFTLQSDATFGSGDGVAGLLDREVEYDEATGLPYLRGRTLKGLMNEEADNILDSLEAAMGDAADWQAIKDDLFGLSSSEVRKNGVVHFGRAQLPPGVRETVAESLRAKNGPGAQDVLVSLTAVRRQTANTPDGIPVDGSLRTMRVVLRQTPFTAELVCKRPLTPTEEAFLAAVVLTFRRAGTGRNRGRGRLQTDLHKDGASILKSGYDTFVQEAGL